MPNLFIFPGINFCLFFTCSGLRKRKRNIENRRQLSYSELEAYVNESAESDYDFSSDDDIKDRSYNPDKESDSSSSDSAEDVEHNGPNDDLAATDSPDDADQAGTTAADPNDEEWTDTEEEPTVFPFTGTKEINVNDLPPNPGPIDYFMLFFDKDILEKITKETNRRANTVFSSKIRRSSREKKWSDISINEMRKFIGLCCLAGTVKFPLLAKQWSHHPLYFHPVFGKTMSRNRFQMILKSFRFVDHATIDENDKLSKIRPVLEKILKNCKQVFSPGQNLSVDEAMIGWKSRLSFRQYISNKSHKYGIKLYELTSDDGFVLNIIIYTGKGTLISEDSTHSEGVVKELMKGYLEKGHTVYLDNFYTSVSLAEFLHKRKTAMVGTLRENRKGNHKGTMKAKLKKGEAVWKRKGPVLLTNWKDKRYVRMISTAHKHSMVEIQGKRANNKKIKPACIIDYNKHMSGIDRADQMMAYYSTPRKTIRWYRKIFFHMIDLCIWNACYIYNFHQNKNIRLLNFREEVIMKLINQSANLQVEDEVETKAKFHFLEPNPPTEKEKCTMKRCRQCTKAKVYKKSRYFCPVCPDKPGLCVYPCFKNWHDATNE